MFSENCVVWIATWVLTPINVVSSPLPSFLLYFLFLWHLFWNDSLYVIFPMSIFHNVENTFENIEHNSFFCQKMKLFVCALYCWNLFFGFFFLIVQKTKQISIRLFFLPNVVKINSCVKYSPSQHFHHKKNLTKTKFLPFGRIFLFFFLFSSIQQKHFFEQTSVLLVLSLCISLS